MKGTGNTRGIGRNRDKYIARLVAGGLSFTDAATLVGARNATSRLAGEPLRFAATAGRLPHAWRKEAS